MKSTYKRLGDYIRQVDVRNRDEKVTRLLGVSIDKKFIESIANTIGTDMSVYKIVRYGQFAYGPVTSRNGDKVSIALLTEAECIISSSYTVFEVIDKKVLLPEYLMLWFMRPEFDRYARFHSHGSAREIFDWEEMCNVELPVSSIEEQQKIVDAYETIERRIALKRKINENLEAQAKSVFNEQFGVYYSKNILPEGWKLIKLEDVCSIKGGKRLPADCELTDKHTNHPYIRVRDVGQSRYVCLNNEFQYIDDYTYNQISRYIVKTDDVIISIVGTIGLLGKIHNSLNGANLTENCVRLTDMRLITSDYLYYTLLYKKQIREIDLLTVGAVQAKLPIYNIQSMPIILPSKEYLVAFQSVLAVINQRVEKNTIEIEMLEELKLATLTKLSC